MNDPGEIILKALAKNNITQAALADSIGIDRSGLCLMISGKRSFSVKHAKEIERVLKIVTAEEILITQVRKQLLEP